MSAVASLLLADSRVPAGSYAHALGVEQAGAEGLDVGGVAPFMRARPRLVAQPDAALSVAAPRAALSARAPGTARAGGDAGAAVAGARADTAAAAADRGAASAALADLDAEHAARCPSPVLRDIARRLGSQLLRSAATAWPSPAIDRYRADSQTTPRPVALGVVGAVAGLSDLDVATVALYDDAATVSSAALKLLGLDPAQTARWLADLAPEIAAMASEVACEHRPVGQQPPPAAVQIELAATRPAT